MHSPDVAKGIWDMAPGLDNPSGVTAGSRGLARLSVPTRQFVCKPDLLLPGCSATRCPARPPACLAWLAPCGCTVQHGPTVLMLVPVSCSHGTPASLLVPRATCYQERGAHCPCLDVRQSPDRCTVPAACGWSLPVSSGGPVLPGCSAVPRCCRMPAARGLLGEPCSKA